ncbi:MAG: DoxX family protein [Holophagaceae bacterium]|nr:DoxX family protein [Holophagaceae bacterium]
MTGRQDRVDQRVGQGVDQRMDRGVARAAGLALGAAFLSAVAARVGLWEGHLSLARYAGFVRYTGEVNAFLPRGLHAPLAALATVAETSLGLALVAGLRPRATALGSAALLLLFGTAMALSQGLKSPLDASVFSAAGAALLLWRHHARLARRVRPEAEPAPPAS